MYFIPKNIPFVPQIGLIFVFVLKYKSSKKTKYVRLIGEMEGTFL